MAAHTASSLTFTATEAYATSTVTSKDGTVIGYRQYGHGSGIVLVQGAMGSAQNFHELAMGLADKFTVYVPDRRGRGISGAGSGTYTLSKDVEDLDALLTKTGAHYVFGLSSGGAISLNAGLTLPAIQKLALFEPAAFLDGSLPVALMKRYEQEISSGNTAAAMVSAMLATQMGPKIFNRLPRWLLEFFTGQMLKSEDKKGAGAYEPMRKLAVALRYDMQVVSEISSTSPDIFRGIKADVLLLGGSTSPDFLKTGLSVLEKVIPHAKRIEFAGLGHGAPWNADKWGKPDVVAAELKRFFGA